MGNTKKTERLPRAEPAAARSTIFKLDDRGEKLCELMIYGAEPEEAAKHGLEPFRPLALEDAAKVVGIRRRNARYIFSQPGFLKAYSKGLADLRNSHKARAVSTLAEIMRDPGEGSAADRAVQVKAANSLIGDEPRGPSVNVQINNGAELQAGICIRLPPGVAAPPLEQAQPAAPTIEHQPTRLVTDPQTYQQRCMPIHDHADDEADQ
jgi:hypothetical protein